MWSSKKHRAQLSVGYTQFTTELSLALLQFLGGEYKDDLEKFFGKKLHNCFSVPPINPGKKRWVRGVEVGGGGGEGKGKTLTHTHRRDKHQLLDAQKKQVTCKSRVTHARVSCTVLVSSRSLRVGLAPFL